MHLTVIVQPKKDAPVPRIQGDYMYCTAHTVHILEEGTTRGQTTIAMMMKGDDGKEYAVELTENIVSGIMSALKGANKRFEADKAGKN